MVWLADGEIFLKTGLCLFVLTESTNVTGRDGHRMAA